MKGLRSILLFLVGCAAFGVCNAQDITIVYDGAGVKVRLSVKDSVSVTADGAIVNVESTYRSHKLPMLQTRQYLYGQDKGLQEILHLQGELYESAPLIYYRLVGKSP